MYVALSIFIMALVTYIPRAIPVSFFKRKIKNQFVKSFLFYVPYAVLSAMTFPAIFMCCSNIYLALIGTVVALLVAFFYPKLYIVAIASVISIYGFSYLFY